MKPTERNIRWLALIVALIVFVTIETFRDYAIFGITILTFIFAIIVLAACVVIPDEVAKWFRGKWR